MRGAQMHEKISSSWADLKNIIIGLFRTRREVLQFFFKGVFQRKPAACRFRAGQAAVVEFF
jgi:hypothetical protein